MGYTRASTIGIMKLLWFIVLYNESLFFNQQTSNEIGFSGKKIVDQEAKRPILRIALPCGSFGQRETCPKTHAKDYCQGNTTFFFGKDGSMSQWLIVDYVWCVLC